MKITALNNLELAEISGGAITAAGPGFAVSVDPFVAAGSVIGNTADLAGSTVDSASGLLPSVDPSVSVDYSVGAAVSV